MSADPAEAAIRRPRGDCLRAVGEIFAQSHADYPAFVFTFPDPSQRREALRRLFTAVARDAVRFDSVFVAQTSDGALHGAAIWRPPGAFPWSPLRQARAAIGFVGVLAAAPRSFRTFMGTGANAARLHPTGSHWYLEALGVVPAAQGHGLGGRLISPILERADKEGVGCYLETSDRANAAPSGRQRHLRTQGTSVVAAAAWRKLDAMEADAETEGTQMRSQQVVARATRSSWRDAGMVSAERLGRSHFALDLRGMVESRR